MRRVTSFLMFLLIACGVAAAAPDDPLGIDPAKFDAQIEAAMLRKDVAFFQQVLSPDVRFSHGTGTVWNKQQWLDALPNATYTARDLDSVEVEPHGDVVETTGHIHIKTSSAKNPEYNIWYVRVYARRDGRWRLLSNRTVRQVNGAMPQK